MSDVYFDTFLEANVELEFIYSEDEAVAVTITINHPTHEDEVFNLEIVGYWNICDIDIAVKLYSDMKKAYLARVDSCYAQYKHIKF